ncbi:polyketide beta-ketoacyl:ACP synthase [Saccharopolyspora erythraea D]|nr:polyketide beta-ketoacyl:ACP synthase [Saccharopolyspora erythraea D]
MEPPARPPGPAPRLPVPPHLAGHRTQARGTRGAMNEVVVTGVGVLNSVADGPDSYAAALAAGRSGVRAADVAAEARTSVGAWLDGFSVSAWADRQLRDDPDADRLAAVSRRAALPARTAACAALAAVRHALLGPEQRSGAALIVAGNNLALDYHADVLHRFRERPGSLRPSHALTHLDTDVVGVVSEVTGIAGEGWTAGAASASGTLAVILGARMVAAGETDTCLVVAPVSELSAAELRAFHDSGAMAGSHGTDEPWQVCRPFDARRRGFVYGQGAAAVVLESRERAGRRGARRMAGIAGWGQRLDARRGTEPDPSGQAAAMRAALGRAGVEPAAVDYVNAHGTGSVVGDAAEARALAEVFGPGNRPLINSTKPLVGHCLASAGLQELVATILQLRGGFAHPNPNLAEPVDPALAFVGPTARRGALHVALSNSVAFGGINAAIVVRR